MYDITHLHISTDAELVYIHMIVSTCWLRRIFSAWVGGCCPGLGATQCVTGRFLYKDRAFSGPDSGQNVMFER